MKTLQDGNVVFRDRDEAIRYARGAGFTVDDYVPNSPVVAGREDMKSVFTLTANGRNYMWYRPYGAST